MKRIAFLSLLAPYFVLALLTTHTCFAQTQGPVAKWSFDKTTGATVRDVVGGTESPIVGVYKHVDGISDGGIRFDGYSTGIICPAEHAPHLSTAFSVEAWIAVNAYPWNWVPIVDQRKEEASGYLFGIDSFGHLGLQVSVNGTWRFLTSTIQIPLLKWNHVAATFDSAHGMTLYLNGKSVGELSTTGAMLPANDQTLLIGRVREPLLPSQWIHPKYKVWYSFDGIIDNLQIYDRSLSTTEVADQYSQIQLPAKDPLSYAVLPSGPPGVGPFGAYYATLKYDEMWEASRRVGPDSDVVVRFDEAPIRFVFWQGTNYIPAWVTENGKWYTDEFMETGGKPGCPDGEDCEPMSDKQNRYAHVRILESSNARAVVHFRYGLCEVEHYICANPDPYTGWTDWGDEYYTIYPDGVAVRKQVLWTSNFNTWHEFQETIIINPPGTRPEDNISTDALTFANMKGQTATYSWLKPPTVIDRPEDANIQMVNLKSKWKPFDIVSPVNPMIKTYTGEKSYSIFEWWNHWPVAQVKSSGISAVAPDRPSHSSLSHIEGQPYAKTSDSMTKITLVGLTNQPASTLAFLAKSWLSPAPMTVHSDGYEGKGYDPTQRAFIVDRKNNAPATNLRLDFRASNDSPLLDPAVVVNNWGNEKPRLKLNGKLVAWDKDSRCGLIPTIEGTNLVIWLKFQATAPTSLELLRTERK